MHALHMNHVHKTIYVSWMRRTANDWIFGRVHVLRMIYKSIPSRRARSILVCGTWWITRGSIPCGWYGKQGNWYLMKHFIPFSIYCRKRRSVRECQFEILVVGLNIGIGEAHTKKNNIETTAYVVIGHSLGEGAEACAIEKCLDCLCLWGNYRINAHWRRS